MSGPEFPVVTPGGVSRAKAGVELAIELGQSRVGVAGVFHKRLTPHEGVDRIDQVGEVVDSCRERCHHCCASGGRKHRGLRSPGGRVVLGNAIAEEEAKAVAKGSGFPLVSLIGDGFRTHGRRHVDTSVFHERRAPRDSRLHRKFFQLDRPKY